MILERIEDGLVWRKLTWIKSHRSLACSACIFFLGGGGGRQKLLVCVCIAVVIIFDDRGRVGIVEL